ncbi:MAG TPA: S4 domain-containing protein YaaA [Bacilli bacterium]|jgi:S4 domain protein YaaA|nr:S4 domain-containing protein YaaA [Acholeplasmataceae bacterium]HNZ77982.1 S4 domain-containing protein YaaA [Bacilli bacterium]HOD61039.1 S4 domain-containing protein YaaA [Bacilli bacterium]HOH60896.1 S4 domain-containing protein YaaA [Bacilli bacterium]HPB48766.1 S4 domain-containing protein YaaA [Bacilli bacterium]
MTKITIKTEYITLGQFLKYVGVIDSGSQAKAFLQDQIVLVNGEAEQRRGRKLYNGFAVIVDKKKFLIGKDDVLSQ